MNEIYHPASKEDGEGRLAALVATFSSHWPQLSDKPKKNTESAIRALWFAAADQGCSVDRASKRPLPDLDATGRDHLERLIGQRLSGVPLAHLVGWQSFMGLEFKAGPQALIPRRETEILGNAALKRLRQTVLERGCATLIDLCTGSGNLAIALAVHEPACQVFAADLSPDAIGLARQNAAFHHLQERADFRVGDLFEPFASGGFEEAVDLVVCNPPYLSTSKVGALPPEIGDFEPREAFDGGGFGLAVIQRLIRETPRYLKPGSCLCFEVGLGQGSFFASRLKGMDAYRTVETVLDEGGSVRALLAGT
jgi:release factor glutamine methyltransferase